MDNDIRHECLFCRIADGEIPATIVWEDEDLVAFKDINPAAPTHILIIPRKHLAGLNDVTAEDIPLLHGSALTSSSQWSAHSSRRCTNRKCGPWSF